MGSIFRYSTRRYSSSCCIFPAFALSTSRISCSPGRQRESLLCRPTIVTFNNALSEKKTVWTGRCFSRNLWKRVNRSEVGSRLLSFTAIVIPLAQVLATSHAY